LAKAIAGNASASAAVVAVGIAVPFAAARRAAVMGWGQWFVGTLLVALATSLPEAASTDWALKIRAIDLVIGNLVGRCVRHLDPGIDELASVDGPIAFACFAHTRSVG
jgi:cation:H+ antiporter